MIPILPAPPDFFPLILVKWWVVKWTPILREFYMDPTGILWPTGKKSASSFECARQRVCIYHIEVSQPSSDVSTAHNFQSHFTQTPQVLHTVSTWMPIRTFYPPADDRRGPQISASSVPDDTTYLSMMTYSFKYTIWWPCAPWHNTSNRALLFISLSLLPMHTEGESPVLFFRHPPQIDWQVVGSVSSLRIQVLTFFFSCLCHTASQGLPSASIGIVQTTSSDSTT